jgi:hypothetical protein
MDPVEESQGPGLSLTQVAFAVGVNLLVLAELSFAVFSAAADPDNFTLVFMKSFFVLLAPTLLAAFFLKRRLRPAAGRAAGR